MSQATTFGHPLVAGGSVTPTVVAQQAEDSLQALLSSQSGASLPGYAVTGMMGHNSGTGQWYGYDGASSLQVAVNVGAPASAAATGTLGDVAWDADYFYICTATDTWKRVAVATW